MNKHIIKLLLVSIFLLAAPIFAHAQLNVVVDRSEEHALVTGKKYGNYLLTLMEKNGVYYLRCAMTTNQFDDHYNAVTLGIDRKGCIATLNDLFSLIESGNEVIVEDSQFGKVTLWGKKVFGVKTLCVQTSPNAGHSYYYRENLELIKKYIEDNLKEAE